MEDVKWLLRKCGLPILLLLIFVIAGVVCWGELHTESKGQTTRLSLNPFLVHT